MNEQLSLPIFIITKSLCTHNQRKRIVLQPSGNRDTDDPEGKKEENTLALVDEDILVTNLRNKKKKRLSKIKWTLIGY